MNDTASTQLIAVAFSNGSELVAWRASLSPEQVELLKRCLANMLELGHVATFGIEADNEIGWPGLLEALRFRCGPAVVDACLRSSLGSRQVRPTFLMPVWAFDHEIDGAPASTAHFLGTDLELTAVPSADEERGVHLPGRKGRWLIHARPMF